MEHFQAHCRTYQTIQWDIVGSHANRHRWGETQALSYWFTNYILSSEYPLLYSIWFSKPLSTVFVLLSHLYYSGFILFLEMLKPLNSCENCRTRKICTINWHSLYHFKGFQKIIVTVTNDNYFITCCYVI